MNKAKEALQKSYDQLKESGGDPEALEKVEKVRESANEATMSVARSMNVWG